MNKLSLLAAAALVACGTLAQAQTATPNPFARPTAPVNAAGAALPGSPSGMPGAQPGFTAAPGMAPPAGIPLPGMPGVAPGAMPGMNTPTIPTTEEDVSAQQVGTVNGVRIFRGQNTYMFEAVKKRKIVRNLTLTNSPVTPPATAAQPGNPNPSLPSMVGRPNPQ